MMKAVAQTEYGTSAVLKIIDVPKPVPGAKDLLVKMYAVATNPVDFKARTNFGRSAKLDSPKILGWDGAGVVEAVGSEVAHYKVGDQVYFAGVLNRAGCNAEYAVVDERIVGRKPVNLTWEQAAAVPLTGLTAWEALTEQMHIRVPDANSTNADRVLLVSAGAGGVGSIAIQLAKRVLKLTVIATASRPESVEFCKKMGADHVIDHSGDIAAQLKAINIKGIDYVLECYSLDKYYDTWCGVLNPLGYICSIVEAKNPLAIQNLMFKRGTLTWELMFTRPMTGVHPEKQRQILNLLADYCEDKIIDPRVTVHFPSMDKMIEAHDSQESGKTLGKLALTVKF